MKQPSIINTQSWVWSTLESLGDGIIVLDGAGLISFINPVAKDILEVSSRAMVGHALNDVLHLRDLDADAVYKLPIETGNELEHGGLRDTCQTTTPSGHTVYIEFSLSPIRTDDGDQRGSILVFRDVTETHMLADRVNRIQKVEAIGNLARTIAHDYTLLHDLISEHAASIAERLLPNSKSYEDACSIIDAASHAETLTQKLLSVARAGDADTDAKLEPVDVTDVFEETLGLLDGVLQDQSILVKDKLQDTPHYVLSSPAQLEDTFMNILLNATNAIGQDGSITIDATEQEVSAPPRDLNPNAQTGNYLVFRIRDTGCGMSRKILDQVFDPFFTTHTDSSAIGLGLTIANANVLRAGGWIRIRSQEGRGASVRIFLPLLEVDEIDDDTRSHASLGYSVMVIEEDIQLRTDITHDLRTTGYNVIPVYGIEDAERLYETTTPTVDLTICDFVLHHDGESDILKRLRACNPTAEVIFLSGFSRDFVSKIVGRGPWGFLQKPFTSEQLIAQTSRRLTQDSTGLRNRPNVATHEQK